MKLDEETIDKIREAYRRLDEVCDHISDCDECPMRPRRRGGPCVLRSVWRTLCYATETPNKDNPA